MRWTWPSWTAIALGAVAAVAALVWASGQDTASGAMSGSQLLAPALLVVGGLLLAAGLHALQGAWSNCCCGDYGCDCGHCEGCREGDCCGRCECYGGAPGNGRSAGREGPSHEGHGHEGGHAH